MNITNLLLLTSISISFCASQAQEIDNEIIFKGIIKQSHDYSCGSAALSTLVSGLIENSQISEELVIQNINASEGAEEHGYSAADLAKVAAKLGYPAEWRKIAKTELPKIKLPVLLLIGLNSDFPHYVVLKGVRNQIAYLADPTRGNIRIPYELLSHEGLNQKHPLWFVMAINPSKNIPPNSTLYLAHSDSDIQANHVTVEQSDAITLASLSREKQLLIDYGLAGGFGNDKSNGIKVNNQNVSQSVSLRYGITNELQVGASVQHADYRTQYSGNNISPFKANSNSQTYGMSISQRFKLEESGRYNLIVGLNGAYTEQNDIYGTGLQLTAYTSREFGQFLMGGSINKQTTRDNVINQLLPQYDYSIFVGANKPFANRYLGYMNLSLSNAQAKNNNVQFNRSYSISTGISYVLSKHFQISPYIGYLFREDSNMFSVGFNITHVGSW
jgi:predicted double-glycine peptidase